MSDCRHYYVPEPVPGGGKVWVCTMCGHVKAPAVTP